MKNKKIIIVDDYPQIRKGLAKALENLGYIVDSAENGKNALELIQKEVPDLLITDFDMPVLNGLELINKLREEGYTFPIILNSGETYNIKKDSIKYNGKLVFRDKSSPSKLFYQLIADFLK